MILIFFNIIFTLNTQELPCNPNDTYFKCTSNLEKQVNFWIKIYTEVPNKLGVLHSPQTYEIYKTIDTNNLEGKAKSKFVVSEKKNLAENLGLNKDDVRFQQGQRDNFIAGLERSYKYLPYIKQIFDDCGLPEDLAYLPHVESSFNYKAYSKMGAAGIWQFMQSTGRNYLEISYTTDERKDPIKATVAACKFIKNNFDNLGSWPLTVTSYNHGLNGMKRALQNHGDDFDNILKNHSSRAFGFASKNFYAEFLAARHIAKNETKYFKDISLVPHNELKYKTIKIKNYLHIDSLIKRTSLNLVSIEEFNPALRSSVLKGRRYIPKYFEFRVSEEKHLEVLNAINSIPQEEFFAEQIKPKWYKVRRGETLASIASSIGTSVDTLVALNEISPRKKLRRGQVLEIPNTRAVETKLASIELKKVVSSVEDAKLIKKEAVEKKLVETKLAVNVKPIEGPKLEVNKISKPLIAPLPTKIEAPVVVEEKEILEPITPENAIATLYGPPEPVQKIAIPDLHEEALLVFNSNEPKNTFGYIRVQPEETLSNFADWLLTPRRSIKNLNKFRRDTLFINQKIKISFNKVTKDEFEQKRIEFHKGIHEDFFNTFTVSSTDEYTLKQGDALWDLCENQFGIPLWLLYAYNPNLDYKKLAAGQIIIVPVVLNK